MSKENVRIFFAALAKDVVLQNKFGEMNARLTERVKGTPPDEEQFEQLFRDELLPAIREAGFSFSAQEWKEYFEESKEVTAFSEEELDAVAAGTECIGIGTTNIQNIHCPCVSSGSGVR